MAVYNYQALDARAKTARGTIAADSAREAREKLRAQGLVVEGIDLLASSDGSRSGESGKSKASNRSLFSRLRNLLDRPSRRASQLASAIRDLATLLGTGIGLVDALDTLTSQYKGRFQTSLMTLRERVAAGSGLADAMRSDPSTFDELTIQMVEVGENAGTLDGVLDQLADFRERYLQFKDRVTTALLYPAIVIALAIGVSIFLMTVVLPMLLGNLIESGRPLPWPTRILKAMSETATTHGWWIALVGLALVAALIAALKTVWGKRLWHRTLFSLPLLGPLAQKQEIARVALVLSTLMKSGIVFVEATSIAARATKNVLLQEALAQMQQRVQSGRDIGEALESTNAFPALVVQIFTVGQHTGKLESMLDRLATGYERQVASATARLTSAVEPILIVVLAIFVGFILFATILPILEAGNVL